MTNGISALPTKSINKNRRKAVRYTSRNRKAILTLKQLLRPNIYIHIKVINISSIEVPALLQGIHYQLRLKSS